MSFDLQTTANIANLARLNLDEKSKEKMAGEIAGILKWVEQLQEVDVTNVEPLISINGANQPMRKDVVTEGDIQAELMQNAPESAHGFFEVPKMVE